MTAKSGGTIEWAPVASVSVAVVAALDATPFRPVARSGIREIRLPGVWRVPLVRISAESDGRVILAIASPRRARRSEHAVRESVNTYLRLGITRFPELSDGDQARELLRLLKNAAVHLSGADIGRPRPQLTSARGPAVRGGLPSLGKRRP